MNDSTPLSSMVPLDPDTWGDTPLTERVITALHEAGHAVAFRRLWGPELSCGEIRIESDGSGVHDLRDREHEAIFDAGLPDEQKPLHWYKVACMTCAGYAALRTWGFPEEVAASGCEFDFQKTENLYLRYCDRTLAQTKEDAIALISYNLPALESLAKRLYDNGTVHPEEADALIDGLSIPCDELGHILRSMQPNK